MLEPKDLEMIAEIVARAVEPLKNDIAELKADVKKLEDRMTELESRVASLESRMTSLESRMTSLEGRMTSVELTLENETNKGINIIAEGHQDLDRKLNQALKIEEEKEILMLRVNYLESELCKVKTKLREIA